LKIQKIKFNKIYLFLFILLGLIVLAPTCQSGITQRGTYPIEIFSEMHYSQAYKNQEPPRLESVSSAQPLILPDSAGSTSSVLNMDTNFKYDSKIGAELYRVNCSFCHGMDGAGDGSVAPYITAENSFYATTPTEEVPGSGNGPYKMVPHLDNISERYMGKEGAINRLNQMLILESGSAQLGPMPSFLWVFTEEQRNQIINFIVDEDAGLASN
jgi:mono/diheme cytochrome c family protein